MQKYLIIQKNKGKYSIEIMCQFFEVSKSGYYDFLKRMDKPDRDEVLANLACSEDCMVIFSPPFTLFKWGSARFL